MRASYHSQVWGTTLKLRGPSLWITINPSDTHNPVVQILAGKQIDMDNLLVIAGPDSDHQARNVANDPYAASKYFFFIINTVLCTLFGITAKRNRIFTTMGLLGHLKAYFGVVEAQGQGTLHLHMLLWLEDTPNCEEMQTFLKTEDF